MTSFRERIWRFLGFGFEESEPDPPLPPPSADDPRLPATEARLDDLVTRLSATPAQARQLLPEAAALLDSLVDSGHPRLAAAWLDKLSVSAPGGPERDRIRERAAALHLELGDAGRALPHLQALIGSPDHAARAHLLLGEHYAREGDSRQALRHFESVLALDVDHMTARARVEGLRASGGSRAASTPVAADLTLAGLDGGVALASARYHLLRELGRGATGAVYLARDVALEREVAVKLLHPAAGAAARARFFAEARVAAALRHPDIVAVLDVDELHHFIVMECCRGGTLGERLRAGPLPAAAALRHHAGILSALAAAHRRGVVHRDLKPANLMFRRPARAGKEPDEIVLADFGVAHLVGEVDKPSLVGTLRYMAPEQRRGEVAPAADVYAAAVILAEMLAGAPRESSGRVAPAPPALPAIGLESGLAADLAAHIASLSAADPGARPAASAALAEAQALYSRARRAQLA